MWKNFHSQVFKFSPCLSVCTFFGPTCVQKKVLYFFACAGIFLFKQYVDVLEFFYKFINILYKFFAKFENFRKIYLFY